MYFFYLMNIGGCSSGPPRPIAPPPLVQTSNLGKKTVSVLLAHTAIARSRPTGAVHNPFLPEFTEYIVYANLDLSKEAAHNPIVEEIVKILCYVPFLTDPV